MYLCVLLNISDTTCAYQIICSKFLEKILSALKMKENGERSSGYFETILLSLCATLLLKKNFFLKRLNFVTLQRYLAIVLDSTKKFFLEDCGAYMTVVANRQFE